VSRIGGLDAGALRDELDEADFCGVVHVVGGDDEAPITVARGFADRANAVAIAPDWRFAVASISKLLTGLTVARLVDAGRLDWQTRYHDLVDARFRPAGLDPTVTMEHLLTHTSGVADYYDEDGDVPYEEIWTRIPSTTIRGPRDMWPLLADLAQVAPPGARAVYNNAAFVLAGIALEELTGEPFPEIVRREVYEPLGMVDSGFWALDDVVPRLAIGYLPPDQDAPADAPAGRWRSNIFAVPAMGGPDGGAQTTVADLVRLLDGLTGRTPAEAAFLRAATRRRVIGPHVVSDDGFWHFGCGVLHVGDGPSVRFGHTGEDGGASARAWTYPASGERLAVVSNVTSGAGAMTRRIDELLAAVPDA
jgi:CubicO group peptidase (beta-lactamase class C family)